MSSSLHRSVACTDIPWLRKRDISTSELLCHDNHSTHIEVHRLDYYQQLLFQALLSRFYCPFGMISLPSSLETLQGCLPLRKKNGA